ncbi:uncharacterized protein LOC131326952 [Rhododendron vialii]|uniref:uncharacterized protein LOC131326952 n=1 Tax=Rhododendron vialii TaxID=182163 RepID=UPI00265D6822|nr:uncharacterized protein LOC131326952 [Rhododendron vialii]
MAKEQVDRAEPPPPPPVVNDSNKSRQIAEHLVFLAFLMERCTAAMWVLSIYLVPPPDVWARQLSAAAGLLIFSNSLYLISLLSSLLKMAADQYDANAIEVAVIGAVTLVIATCVAIIETLRTGSLIRGVTSVIIIGVVVLGAALIAEDERKNQIEKENTGQQESKLDFSSKESKEEVQAKEDEKNEKIDEELTRQQKAKLDVSLKESKEEVRRRSSCSSEEFQSLEAKYDAKYENLLQKYLDRCHGWEEGRSQLMKELGAARASSEIYRELLHGSDDF